MKQEEKNRLIKIREFASVGYKALKSKNPIIEDLIKKYNFKLDYLETEKRMYESKIKTRPDERKT